MGFLSSFFTSNRDLFSYRLILDIGTEFVKAAIVEFNNSERTVLGFGREKQDYKSMDGGAITDINGVIRKARSAIEKAGSYTPHQPEEMVCGIAGEFVKGVLISLDSSRRNPGKKIYEKELFELIKEGQEDAYQKAVKMAEMETGVSNVKLELIQQSIVEVKVDGYKVKNPCSFQGKNINMTVFYSFAPLVQVGALRTVASELGYRLVGVVAEPFAIASSFMNNDSYEFGAIIVDIGGGTTDIALIRNGGIEGTRMFAMGGRAFTRSLASKLRIGLEEAEEIKLAYSRGEKIENYTEVDRIIKSDLHILYQGLELSLQDLASGELLPANIFFCGGGSALKGLLDGLKKIDLKQRLPFSQPPAIRHLSGKDIKSIKDENSLLTGVEHTTPRSLAYYGAVIVVNERRLMNLESQRLQSILY
jgi:cell division protein FtsA